MRVTIAVVFAGCFVLERMVPGGRLPHMLFGTWRNPAEWNGRCGFDAPREEHLADMLRFRDVHDNTHS